MSDFIVFLRLVWCVVVRNWVVYRKDFLANISPTLADPALMMVALGMGLSPFIGTIHGLRYSEYLAPGMAATTVLFTAFFECSYGFYVRMTFESVYKAMLTTPIGTTEVVGGEFLWVFIRAGLMATGVGLVLAAMGLLPNPWSVALFPLIGGTLAQSPAAPLDYLHRPMSATSTSSKRFTRFSSPRSTSFPASFSLWTIARSWELLSNFHHSSMA
jgi:lipooligosaccharide transport system permease protein